MFLNFAFRYVLAYKRRSAITVLLGAVSTALLIFTSAWMDGSHGQLIKNSVEIYSGYIQVTASGFRENPGFDKLVFDYGSLQDQIKTVPGVDVVSPRLETFVLFSAGEKAVGGMLIGIDPDKEKRISRLFSSLKGGAYLVGTDTIQLYIGSELARRLKLDLGDELAFVGSGTDYSFAADKLVVKGIFQTGLFEFDASAAFLAKPYFDSIMASENIASQVIVLPKEPVRAAQLASVIRKTVGGAFEVASWQQTMSALLKSMKLDSVFGYITLGLIFIVIFFVVMIYTLLAVFSRVKEIGIMRAIGTTPREVLLLLLLESSFLSFLSVVLGGIAGALSAYYFSIYPVSFTGMEEQFKQYGLAVATIPTSFKPLIILRDMAIMFFLLVLATLYPIIKVNCLKPIEAIHHV